MTTHRLDTPARALDRQVQLLRWPAQQELREHCASRGLPRILVVEAGLGAPLCQDIYEDWVRAPVPTHDLKARADALAHRYHANRTPHLDDNGLLTHNNHTVALSPMQAELLTLLLANYRHVVPREALRHHQPDTTLTRNALDLHMMRIRQRITPLSLTIRTAWGRGYTLDTQPTPSTTA
jgi:hypothetical protein